MHNQIQPMTNKQQTQYQIVESAIRYLADQQQSQPSLSAVASHVGLSEFHLQRVFSEWAGVSPKQFLQFLTKQEAKRRLREMPVMEAALESGLSGSGRLHDLFVQCESVTPGEVRKLGGGLQISYGVHPTLFGPCLVAVTQRGVCKLAFVDDTTQAHEALTQLSNDWPCAEIVNDSDATAPYAKRIFKDTATPSKTPLRVVLRGSPFQVQVWEALLRIPDGELSSYGQLAASIEKPSASRAVASAVAANSLAYLIPCHRVIRSTGTLNNYRWGEHRKAAMIGWEAASSNNR